ncbi:MAG: four helix bundle protein [Pseudomonadota bacterium]
MPSYRDLVVWQRAMELAESAYGLSRLMPQSERYGLTSQLLRAAVSIPANIAEGRSRTGRREFARFLSIACGSLAETETLLEIAARTGLVGQQLVEPIQKRASEVGRMLTALRRRLNAETLPPLGPKP